MGIGKAALQNTGHTFDLAVQLRTLEEAFPNLMVVGSRLWIELAFHLNGREKTKTPLGIYTSIYLPKFREGTHFIIKTVSFVSGGPYGPRGVLSDFEGGGGGVPKVYNRTDPK